MSVLDLYRSTYEKLTFNFPTSVDRQRRQHIAQGRWSWIPLCHLSPHSVYEGCCGRGTRCTPSPVPRFYS